MYRISARPDATRPATRMPAAGELLVPVEIGSLSRQLRQTAWHVLDGRGALVSLWGSRGSVILAPFGRGGILYHPRFRIRLVSDHATETRIVVSDPQVNRLASTLSGLAGLLVGSILGLGAPFLGWEVFAGGSIAVLGALVSAALVLGPAFLGHQFLGERHAVHVREHLLEQARIVATASAPRNR